MTGKLFALTARDQNGDLVEWFVEAMPGTLACFTEDQARGGLYAPAVFSTCAQMRLRSRSPARLAHVSLVSRIISSKT
jgi:hypothetical protein